MTDIRQALEEAFRTIYGAPDRSNGFDYWKPELVAKRLRFNQLIQAEAWTDAAMMFIPTDGSMSLIDIEYSFEPTNPSVWSACTVRWYPPHKSGADWRAAIESGPTPAHALLAACLKAKEQADG